MNDSDRERVAKERMVRRLKQASQGTGVAVKALQQFGLDPKDLVKLERSRQFELVCQHINFITNPVEKLAAAVAIFDMEGSTLVAGREL